MVPPSDITTVRPRLRDQVFFAPAATGAHLVDGERVVTVQAAWAYPLLERIGPHLTGDLTVAELTRALSEDKRRMVERLVTVLRDENFVRDLALDRPHRLSEDELRTYGAEIAFVESFVDSAPHRFQTWRDSRLLLVGSGPALVSLAGAALRCGVRDVRVTAVADRVTDFGRIEEHRTLAVERDAHQRLTVRKGMGTFGDEDPLDADVAWSDVVLHACGLPCPGHAELLDDLCRRHGALLVQAVTSGDEAWIGPVSRPDRPDTGWRAAWLRIRGNELGTPESSAPGPTAEAYEFLTGPIASIIANHLVFAAFNHVTGVTPEQDGPAVTRLDLETLTGEAHKVVPHHAALAVRPSGAEDVVARVADLAGRSGIEDETFSREVTGLLDARTGVLSPFDEADLPQLPLRVTRLTVAGPDGMPHNDRVVVTGAALDFAEARFRAARLALAVRASLVVDPRRRLPSAEGQREAAVYGVCLRGGEPVPVPEREAFPAWYRLRDGLPYTPPVGLAAAPSWAGAVERGMLAHRCDSAVTEALERLRVRGGPLPRLDPAAVDPGEEGRQTRRLLEVARRRVDVLDLTAGEEVPAYAFLLDGVTVAHHAGLSTAEAVREGLRTALLAHQAQSARRPDLAPPPVPRLPASAIAGEAPPARVRTAPPTPDARLKALTDFFSASGRRAVAVPLDSDPTVSAVLPFVVQVVVTDV